ncbi:MULTISPECIES: hypothetical protein [unclassified Crossiella]|uniref:hypothetical protein n=1 Tax=unclassified Crossiella TaxID=2620835 RepID=UPI002000056B|nr:MULTISPECIES: hypothetical protein [unclassified Crossiella]MCK2242025.1 hypothetical protein [Crossiella sp. S99.2]MCK2255928.1 hypothetical protein [Crossiella sp. S99.1]
MERTALRVAACCAVIGSVAYLVLTLVHGFLPGTAHELAGHVLARDWRAIHLGTILALLLWVVAFTAVGSLIVAGPGALLVRLARPLLVIGFTVFAIDFALDGFGFAQLAEAGAHAELDLMFRAVVGSTTMLVQVLFGLAFAVWALVLLRSRRAPGWLCVLGLVAATGWFLGGCLMFLRVPGFGFPVVAPLAGVVQLWVLGLGISWWRQSAGSVTGRQSTGVDRTIALEVSP